MAVTETDVSSLNQRNRARAGDLAVEAYQRFGSDLLGYLRRNLRCIDDADDVAQDVYLRIAGHQKPQEVRSLRSITFTIARNLLIDRSRLCETLLAKRCVPVDNVNLPRIEHGPCDEFEADQRLKQLNEAFASLPRQCRMAFLMSRVEGYTYPRIAEKMHLSVSMIEKHIGTVQRSLSEYRESDC